MDPKEEEKEDRDPQWVMLHRGSEPEVHRIMDRMPQATPQTRFQSDPMEQTKGRPTFHMAE